MEMNEDGTEMGLTPKFRSEFIREESIGFPKDINLTVLNLPLLVSFNLQVTFYFFYIFINKKRNSFLK